MGNRGTSRLVVLVVLGVAGCAKDVVLPVDSVCGDGVQDGNEECDVESAGCTECHIVPGFECTDESCRTLCNDGIVVPDEEECDPPNGTTCDSSCRSGTKAESCDMTGYWIARQTDFSIDVLSQVQTSSNWYVLRLSQTGEAFQVEQGLTCGVKVTGSATAEITEAGTRALLHLNPQGVDAPAGPRRGTFAPVDGHCQFAMDRRYMVRGAEPRFLPTDFAALPELSTLTELPHEENPETPTGANLDGAVDVDGDGHPGIAYRISGNASGLRNVVQRDWNEYVSRDASPIPEKAIEFVARSTFDNQENVLHVSQCPVIGCGILLAGSAPAANIEGRVTFRYLGKDLSEARVSLVVTAAFGENDDADMATCTNARAALEHDGSKE